MIFKLGDLVWVYLRKERFPNAKAQKLAPIAYGLFKVLERINDNAYWLELPKGYRISTSFYVAYLSPYVLDEEEQDSKVNLQ